MTFNLETGEFEIDFSAFDHVEQAKRNYLDAIEDIRPRLDAYTKWTAELAERPYSKIVSRVLADRSVFLSQITYALAGAEDYIKTLEMQLLHLSSNQPKQ